MDKKLRCKLYENRELSWLKFNERVLEEANNPEVPLCERISFLSIFQTNLDEFFMVRVGALSDQMLLPGKIRDNKTRMTPKQQLHAIMKKVVALNEEKDAIYHDLIEAMQQQGVCLKSFSSLKRKEKNYLALIFEKELMPLLSPMVIRKKQLFPFLNGQDIYALGVLENKNGKRRLGMVPCSHTMIPRLIRIPGYKNPTYVLSEELILQFLPKIFVEYKIEEKTLLRISRNADIDLSKAFDEDLDYRDTMAEIIKQRKKLSPVRLELSRKLNTDVLRLLCKQLELDRERVFYSKSPLDLSFFYKLQEHLRRNISLFYPRRIPQFTKALDEQKALLPQIENKDILLSYPYESIRPFLKLLFEAARDPEVVSIRMTLYRLAKASKVVEALVEAAENGKQVDVLVELKARFDEENNIEWSKTLEEAGCHVIYGIDGLKVHSKLCLITRYRQGEYYYITQIGTGNYNERTSRLYTDLSLLTANQILGLETNAVFEALLRGEVIENTKHLLVAPKYLQKPVLEKIEREIQYANEGKAAYIGLKMNSLSDKKIINKLIKASMAGVKIELLIRGICCVKGQVPEFTENITVKSIVGRYLEHSRFYIFGTADREEIYISSADFMTRNTVKRVEVAAPIWQNDLKTEVREMFSIMFQDNKKARVQNSDGSYSIPDCQKKPLNAQEYLFFWEKENL